MIINSNASYLLGETSLNRPIICHHNLIDVDNIAATSSHADFPVVNLANPATNLYWKANATTAQDITITLTDNEHLVDYIAIARHNLYSCGATITITGDAGGGSAELVEEFSPTSDDPIIITFDPNTYIELVIEISAADVAAQIAVVYCGEMLRVERNMYVGYAPMTLNTDTDAVSGFSESGNFLGRIIVNESRTGQMTINNLTPAWVRSDLKPFLADAKSRPFFFAWRPSSYPEEVVFAWQVDTQGPYPQNSLPNGMMNFSMNLKALT